PDRAARAAPDRVVPEPRRHVLGCRLRRAGPRRGRRRVAAWWRRVRVRRVGGAVPAGVLGVSDTKPTVVEALSRVMAAVQAVRKGDRNQQQGYSFRGIDAVVNAVGPALREHGVIVVPHVEDAQYSTVEVGARRTPMRECTVRVRYVFHGPAGDT